MKQARSETCSVTSLIGTLTVLAIGYLLAKNLPDIVRYIRISRM
jgi:hypothetical protein